MSSLRREVRNRTGVSQWGEIFHSMVDMGEIMDGVLHLWWLLVEQPKLLVIIDAY
jgi:hypothetical protein